MIRVVLATLIVVGLISKTAAQPATPAAVIEHTGQCIQFTEDKEVSCQSTVSNVRFVDGYDSFQFRIQDKDSGSELVFAFIGAGYETNKAGGEASKLADTMVFMPLKQVNVMNMKTKKNVLRSHPGQCVLEFNAKDARDFNQLRKIWCEYYDGKQGKAFGLMDISESKMASKRFDRYE